ncbi:MAG: Flp pilus assembly complex ATPase component TadA, partial [Deltaproteobacteria bacterium]|nr:Flp pilus assembly complex ATPase component TadA [Deltaproteobacteria bacterium]
MFKSSDKSDFGKTSVQNLKSEVAYRTKLQGICNKIYAATDLDEILINLREEITSLFKAERITVFVVDGKRRELFSRFKSGSEVEEIRIPAAAGSIAGCCALKQKIINIKNVYDNRELATIDPDLKFDNSWDKKTGFTTKQVLAVPIIFKKYMLGVIQLINRKSSDFFSKIDETSVEEMAKILGIALFNQKRIAKIKSGKFDYLLENHILTEKELSRAIEDARIRKQPVETVLMKDLRIPKKEIGQSLSKFYNVPFVEYNKTVVIPGELLTGLKVPFMRNNVWVPLRLENGKIVIIIDNPQDLQRIGEIKTLFPGKTVTFHVALKQDVLDFIKLFTQDEKQMAGIEDIMSQLEEEEAEIEEAESGVDDQDSAVVQIVNKIILDAYERGASDIHVEPYSGKEKTEVRIRIDGSCMVYQTIPFNYRNAIISRLKIMSDLDIAERRKPQDGKIKFKKFGGKDIELRVATVPTQGGLEDVVMRILSAGEPLPLNKMGFSQRNYKNFISVITQPYGIIFVCGPTGSGKTTTLHSALG